MPSDEINLCISCGACCAHYRAAFYWAEADDTEGGTVPVELTDRLDLHRRVMKGTNRPQPRCIALHGEIGRCVSCTIYEQRPSICREFFPSWQNGLPNDRCDRARAAWGLPVLQPSDKIETPAKAA